MKSGARYSGGHPCDSYIERTQIVRQTSVWALDKLGPYLISISRGFFRQGIFLPGIGKSLVEPSGIMSLPDLMDGMMHEAHSLFFLQFGQLFIGRHRSVPDFSFCRIEDRRVARSVAPDTSARHPHQRQTLRKHSPSKQSRNDDNQLAHLGHVWRHKTRITSKLNLQPAITREFAITIKLKTNCWILLVVALTAAASP